MTEPQKQKRQHGRWDEATWVAVGAGTGAAVGVVFGDGAGVGIGVALGAGLGLALAGWRGRHGPGTTS